MTAVICVFNIGTLFVFDIFAIFELVSLEATIFIFIVTSIFGGTITGQCEVILDVNFTAAHVKSTVCPNNDTLVDNLSFFCSLTVSDIVVWKFSDYGAAVHVERSSTIFRSTTSYVYASSTPNRVFTFTVRF